MADKKIHIGIDGNLLCGKRTGMGMNALSIIKQWHNTDTIKITLFAPEDDDAATQLKNNGINVKVLGKHNYFFWEQIILPKAVKSEDVDVLWCPYNTAPLLSSCPIVVTIHDVIYMSWKLRDVPTLYKKLGLIYRRCIVPFAAKRAKKIFTDSEFAKQEILSYFPKTVSKIDIAYLAADADLIPLEDLAAKDFLKNHGIRKPFILGLGSLESRKNSFGLIKAYTAMPEYLKKNHQLVLFGFRGYENSPDKRFIEEEHLTNIVILGYISNAEKATLYKESSLFVFPTFAEGFGAPPIEAMECGAPVITSNVTSMPEVCGDAALYVDPDDDSTITEKMIQILQDTQLKNQIIARGLEQCKKFSWEKTARQVLDVIIEVGKSARTK